jgi:HAD superfamily hydrolase (TIGR01459 family)
VHGHVRRMIALASTLGEVARPFAALFVDVWGVVHNGVAPYEQSTRALRLARKSGKAVILISNAPRLASEIPRQFERIGVPADIYNAIVTSGDATRAIIERWTSHGTLRLHHIGPDRDLSIFEGLDIERVSLSDASHVVCTGLIDDETETPDDYAPVLGEIAQRKLPFLCANPDIVVQRGDVLVFCAGALAKELEALGRPVVYPGKPHAPIYELAFARVAQILRRAVAKSEVLAIGDGLATDILGAERFGIASLFIASGIHAQDLAPGGTLDLAKIEAACTTLGVHPIAAMTELGP